MKTSKKLSLVIGTGLTIGLASISIANAQHSPFSATKLDSGYNLAGHQVDTTMGEKKSNGKSGGDTKSMDKKTDGKCGAGK